MPKSSVRNSLGVHVPTAYVLGAFVLALLLRLLFLAWRGPILTPDSSEYLTLAHNLVAHHSFSLELSAPYIPSIRRSPAYPALLAILGWLGLLTPVFVAVTQAVLDAAVAAMTLLIARAILPLKWAMFAAISYAIHPGAIYTTATVLSESLFTFLQVSAIAFLIYGLRMDRIVASICAGLCIGLAILCRPIDLLLPFLVCAMLLVFVKFPRQRTHAILFLIASIIVVAPWSMRTSYVSGQLVLVQGHGAINYWVPTVLTLDQSDQPEIWKYQAEILRAHRPSGPYSPARALEDDRFLTHEAIANVRANPRGYLLSRARAFPHLFITSFDSFTGINNSFAALWAKRDLPPILLKATLLLVFSVAPLLLSIVGLVSQRRDLFVVLLGAMWIFVLLAHLPLWIEYRFWVPFVPFLLITAAVGGSKIANRFRFRVTEKG